MKHILAAMRAFCRQAHLALTLLAAVTAARIAPAAGPASRGDDDQPHTPTLAFYVSALSGQADADRILAAMQKLPSMRKVSVNLPHRYVQVRFDSHTISYQQVAQGIAAGKKFEPALKIRIPEYSQGENAARVDAVFAKKRLNQRVRIEPLDKTKGEFLVHLLPLKVDPAATGPQGFNGGHLNHPIHDKPPRGLGLTCIYAAGDEVAVSSRP